MDVRGVLGREVVAGVAAALAEGCLPSDAAALAGLLTGLEELKATVAAVQARASVALADQLVAEQREAGVPAARVGRGVAAAVAFARRESPHAGDRWLGFARALVDEMPVTFGLVESGVLSEYRASLIVRETACLTVEDRQRVDAELGADPARLATWGNRQVAAEAQRIAYRLDPQAAVRRTTRAVADRNVSLRPAPDGMTWLTALLPVAQGVSCLKALRDAADGARVVGDPRSRGQVMADTLVTRLTGQASADAVGVGLYLVMSEESLFEGGSEPAMVPGLGPINAPLARGLVARAATDQATLSWVRRLHQKPRTGELIALDSRSRRFPAGLAALIQARDQMCRTPWCDAPIRHTDHAIPVDSGGATSYANGQGLCEACNHTKQAPGWETLPRPGPHAPIRITSPTGQSRDSRAPRPPGAPLWPPPVRVDIIWPGAA